MIIIIIGIKFTKDWIAPVMWDDVVLSDPDGYQNMSAGGVLADLFGE